MPRDTKKPETESLDQKLAMLRQGLETLPANELAGLIGRVREAQTDKALGSFEEAWRSVESAADEFYVLTGRALPAPASLEDVFENSPIQAGRRRSRPEAWYTYEITNVIRFAGEDGASEQFISDFITARGGDARHAVRSALPALIESGFVTGSSDDGYSLANHRPDAWYDYTVLAFVNNADPSELPTTKQVHDHVIAQGGHGAEVVTTVLPRLESAGRIVERGDGHWDSATRRPDAWYDHTISSFVLHASPDALPTTKNIHDYVIAQGGHGAIAVSEALPRLASSGHLVEVDDGVWDAARRRPQAWYDYTVIAMLNDADGPVTTMQVNDHVIAQGGHGAEAISQTLPRLVSAGKLRDLGDGTWDLAERHPRAWYDHAVISEVRHADPHALPTFKTIHDAIIAKGGHGAFLATTVIPELLRAGELIEVDDGVYDLATRRTEAWYEQTVLSLLEASGGEVTTMQVNEHVIAQGGHGAEAVSTVLPRLERAGLVTGTDTGVWMTGPGVPLAYVEAQVLAAIKAASPEPVSFEACTDALDEDLAEESFFRPAIESLLDAGLIDEFEGEGDMYGLSGVAPRKAARPSTRRPRVRRAA